MEKACIYALKYGHKEAAKQFSIDE